MGNAGAILATAPLAWMAEMTGWRWAFAFVGFLSIIFSLTTALLVREPSVLRNTTPVRDQLFMVLNGWKQVILRKRNWVLFFAYAGIYGALISFQGTWGVPYLMHVKNMSPLEASTYTGFISTGIMAGSIFTGWISDRMQNRKWPFVILQSVFMIAWLILFYTSLYPGLLIFIMGAGVSSFVLIWPMARESNETELAGSSMSLVNAGAFSGVAVLQIFSGLILDRTWSGRIENGVRIYSEDSYEAAFALLWIFLMFAIFLLALYPEKKLSRMAYVQS
jgi:sugar phosphate permease